MLPGGSYSKHHRHHYRRQHPRPGLEKGAERAGTFRIILSSVLTLFLCFWTANIQPKFKPNASTWEKLKHRLFFVAIGTLTPEAVLAIALYEWRKAREFHRAWCELYDIVPGSRKDTLRMPGAFFVTMGGVGCHRYRRIKYQPTSIYSPRWIHVLYSTCAERSWTMRREACGIIHHHSVHRISLACITRRVIDDKCMIE